MLVCWIEIRSTFDLLICFRAKVSSCFPLNSRNSPNTILLPLSSTLHHNQTFLKKKKKKTLRPELIYPGEPNLSFWPIPHWCSGKDEVKFLMRRFMHLFSCAKCAFNPTRECAPWYWFQMFPLFVGNYLLTRKRMRCTEINTSLPKE